MFWRVPLSLTFWAFAPLRSYFSVTICPSFVPIWCLFFPWLFQLIYSKMATYGDCHSLPCLLSSALLYSFVHNAFYTRNALTLCFWSSDWNRKNRCPVSAVVAPWPAQVFGTGQSKWPGDWITYGHRVLHSSEHNCYRKDPLKIKSKKEAGARNGLLPSPSETLDVIINNPTPTPEN